MAAMRWERALVTGASSGIGEAFARVLAAEGSSLVLVARRRERLVELADELGARHGVEVEVIVADLTAPVALAGVERRLADQRRPIDLLVNNAGFGTSGPFLDLPVAREQQEIDLNVTAVMRLSWAALRSMRARGRGNVLNVASIAALSPTAGAATYSATKAFVVHFSESLHAELASEPVAVTVSLPGFTRSEFHRNSGTAPTDVPAALWLDATVVAEESLDAAARGEPRVVPSAVYRVAAAASRVVPRRPLMWAVRMARRRTHRG